MERIPSVDRLFQERILALEAIRVRLLGGFKVSAGSRTIEDDAWRLRKAASLVKLLALAPGHRMHRERAAEDLWPNAGRRASANNLRQAMHAARSALHHEPAVAARILASSGELLALCPEGSGTSLWVDAEDFEEAAGTARRAKRPAAYEAALDLYAGELLPEDRYEGWTEEPRARLRGTYLSLLSELAGFYEGRSDLGSAERVLLRLLAEEQSSEGAHASLMRVYALGGRRGEALAQYARLEGALSRNLGLKPSASVRALREEIASGRYPPRDAPHEILPWHEGSPRHKLPSPRTTFVGRERELLEVKRELASTRLLTLAGAGGSGKTRLALEVGRDLAGAYPEGAWLVELAPLSQGDLVAQEVAGALNVREQPGEPIEATLTRHLRDKEALLLLDNCEHLLEACAALSDVLLGSCPRLRILATSREPLGVADEVVWRVPPLAVPQRSSRADELSEFAAVRLFVERARLKLPVFALTAQNARAVSEVCRRLEGVPLAVELAAARMGAMAAEHLAERLDDTLGVLSSGPRTASSRHGTMRATLEWSHGLLSGAEKEAFGRLSVFAGGFSLEAAEAVVPGGDIAPREVLGLVSSLVEKSLLLAEVITGAGEEPRYRMLEPVGKYASEKLEQSTEAELALHQHAEFFLDVAEEAVPHLRGPDQLLWLERLTEEHDNVRAAMRWLLENGEPEKVARFGWELWLFWWIRGHFAEGRRWMEEALAGGDAMPPREKARALFVAGTMAIAQADYRAAEPLIEESIGLFGEQSDELGTALAMGGAGIAAVNQGRYEEGIAHLEEARGLYQKLGSEWGMSAVLVSAAGAWMALGDHGQAERAAGEGLALARRLGDRLGTSIALYVLAAVTHASGDQVRAKGLFGEGLALAAELGDEANVVYYLEELGAVSASEGKPIRAARLWGAAESLLESVEATAYPHRPDPSLHQHRVAAARASCDEAPWVAAWSEGRSMSAERAVEFALSAEAPAPPETNGNSRSVRKDGPPADGSATADPPSENKENTLTRRERQIVDLISGGCTTNRRISAELFISERTVETHVRNILKKLGLDSRAQLAAWATERLSFDDVRN